MVEVGPCLVEPRHGTPTNGGALSESSHLTEDEPHPVGGLRAAAQLGEGGVVGTGGVLVTNLCSPAPSPHCANLFRSHNVPNLASRGPEAFPGDR